MSQTIADKLTHINTTKGVIRNAIVAKGVEVPADTPFRQYGAKIAAIPQEVGPGQESGSGWTRPTDRPAFPFTDEPDDNNIWMLYGIGPTGVNDMAFQIAVVGGYYVDWGDGVVEVWNDNSISEHLYSYDQIPAPPDSDGIKWAWIHFYAQVEGAAFTQMSHAVRPSGRIAGSGANIFTPRVFEIYMKATQLSFWSWTSSAYTRYSNCQVFYYYGENQLTSFNYWAAHMFNLRELKVYTGRGINFGYFLYSCYSFNQPLDIDTSNATSLANFLDSCYSFNQPLNIDTSKSTTFISFVQHCYAFNQPLAIDTSKGFNFSYFLRNCYSFNQPLDIDTSKGTNFSSFLYNCYSFNQPLDIDTSKGTNFTNFLYFGQSFNQPLNIDTSKGAVFTNFLYTCPSHAHPVTVDLVSATTAIVPNFIGNNCKSLPSLRLLNMSSLHSVLTISQSALSADDLELLFGDLCDRSGLAAGTLTITGVAGLPQLTNDQRAIATNKNWSIMES